jgi:hypothetical protein
MIDFLWIVAFLAFLGMVGWAIWSATSDGDFGSLFGALIYAMIPYTIAYVGFGGRLREMNLQASNPPAFYYDQCRIPENERLVKRIGIQECAKLALREDVWHNPMGWQFRVW